MRSQIFKMYEHKNNTSILNLFHIVDIMNMKNKMINSISNKHTLFIYHIREMGKNVIYLILRNELFRKTNLVWIFLLIPRYYPYSLLIDRNGIDTDLHRNID